MSNRHQFNFGELRNELINSAVLEHDLYLSLKDLEINYTGNVPNLLRLVQYTFTDFLIDTTVSLTRMDIKKVHASRLIKSLSEPNVNIDDDRIYGIFWFSFTTKEAQDFFVTIKEYKGLVPLPNVVFYTWTFERMAK